MRVHLLTYATPRFYLRQKILGWSARLNRVADTVTAWGPASLRQAGFERDMPEIDLTQRGSGFWAWKPYIIDRKLNEVPNGDLVFYCDVGRTYPFKLLQSPVAPYLEWMRSRDQQVMPGLHIPWKGPMSMWTKRASFVAFGLDDEVTHRSAPIQASFSFWLAGKQSRSLCSQWLRYSSQSELINDEPSRKPMMDLPDYFENRHDQSLLSLCCLHHGIVGIDIGSTMPAIDTKHPDQILECMGHVRPAASRAGRGLTGLAHVFATFERKMRKKIRFGENRPEPD
ncbi:MAG: hypothetical protein ACKO2G_16545 [Verrucomicrobiales bacterium]